jgi:two-component system NtrC family response regulator
VPEERPVPFLEAMNEVPLAWGQLLWGRHRECLTALEPAAGYFRKHGLASGAALCACLAAEARLGLGEAPGPLPPAGGSDLSEALGCLVAAASELQRERTIASRARSADWLARAAAALGVCGFAAGSERLEVLREKLRAAAPTAGSAGEPEATAPAGDSETRALQELKPAVQGSLRERLVTRSPRMAALASLLERLRGTELPVLIGGETGTGKELVARILHEESPRGRGPFFVVDCATLPAALLETELFGARAGAFTDLTGDRPGILALARGGTVLIDEIGSMPLESQAKLLRAIGERSVRPVGAEREVEVDVRFLFSTSMDLAAAVKQGAFRSDLLHRLGVVSIRLPPLRERPEDFPELILALSAGEAGAPPSFAGEAMTRLLSHGWPGNVRELKNLLLRLRVQAQGVVTAEQVESLLNEPGTRTIFPRNLLAVETLPSLRERLDRDYLVHHYRRLQGDSQALCAFLGLGRRQLYRWCARLGIRLREER